MTPKPKPPEKRQHPLRVEWDQREGWKPFGHRLGGLTLADQGFLTGKHKIEPKKPKGQ